MSHTQPIPHADPASLPESMAWEIISTYSRAEALDDGLLIDVTRQAAEAGFKIPVAVTRAAWADCVEWTEEDNTHLAFQDQSGRLWDVLWMAVNAAKRDRDADRITFQVFRVPRDRSSVAPIGVSLEMSIGPGDTLAPVITIGFASDF